MKPVKQGDVMVVQRPAQVVLRVIILMVLCMMLGAILMIRFGSAQAADLHDPRVETACKTPTQEGSMTVQVIYMGKHLCWRWVAI